MSFFGNNEIKPNVIRVTPEKQQAYKKLMKLLENASVSNADAGWLGMVSNIPNPFSYDDDLLELQATRLQGYLDIQAHVFPFSQSKGIIFLDDMPDSELVLAFKHSQVPCYGGVWDEENRVIEPMEWEAVSTTIAFNSEGKASVKTEKWTIPAYDPEVHGKASAFDIVGEQYMGCCPAVRPISFYQVRHLVNILRGLDPLKTAEFTAKVCGMKIVEEGVCVLQPDYGNDLAWAELKFDFVNHCISTSRDFPQRLETFITNIGAISVEVSMALQAIEIAGLEGDTSQRQIDAILSARTQVFEEEDVYGAEMFQDEQLRTIRDHSIALMMSTEGWGYPHFTLMDNNTPEGVDQCINWLIEEGREFFPDKNGMKRVVVDQGVTALMLGMVGDTAVFITDVQKPKKTLNRNWQAVAIRAMEGIPGTEGYRPYKGSALRVMNRRYPAI